jgi:hypothetical protein
MKDLVLDRRRVRLLEGLKTLAGDVFKKGEVFYVRGASCGRLHLEDEHRTRYIRMVSLKSVEMADELLLFQVPRRPLKAGLLDRIRKKK